MSDETAPFEPRIAQLEPGTGTRVPGAIDPCPWCRWSLRLHSPEARARCEERMRSEVDRRAQGPVRVRDLAHARDEAAPNGGARGGAGP